jgi:ABC-2 type transport system ATP-binding protein
MLLEAKNLEKTFTVYKKLGWFRREKKQVKALQNFSLEIDKPIIYGLVGPNGAGKTTFIKHCLGLVENDVGQISVLGYNPYQRKPEFLQQVGLVSGQKQNLDPNLPAIDSMILSGYVYNMQQPKINQRIEELVNLFDLKEKIHTPVRQLSLGQKMKFEIISSILHSPKFLFMDEPTLGLDFDSQNTMRKLLKELNQTQGLSILLTSHYMPDITNLCQRVAVIDKGQKMFDGSLDELRKSSQNQGYLKTLVEELNKESLVED